MNPQQAFQSITDRLIPELIDTIERERRALWERIAELEAELTTLRSWRDSVVARSVAAGRKVPGEGLCDWFEMLAECVAKLEAELAARPMVEPEAARKLREAVASLPAEDRAVLDNPIQRPFESSAGFGIRCALRAFCESAPPTSAPSESERVSGSERTRLCVLSAKVEGGPQ